MQQVRGQNVARNFAAPPPHPSVRPSVREVTCRRCAQLHGCRCLCHLSFHSPSPYTHTHQPTPQQPPHRHGAARQAKAAAHLQQRCFIVPFRIGICRHSRYDPHTHTRTPPSRQLRSCVGTMSATDTAGTAAAANEAAVATAASEGEQAMEVEAPVRKKDKYRKPKRTATWYRSTDVALMQGSVRAVIEPPSPQ